MEAESPPIQMINGDGNFDEVSLENVIRESGELSFCGNSYNVVSIIGPQNSGKSYFLNCLFGTNFDVMDATTGWKKTTKGIWIQCTKPRTIVMDIEGSDGYERGEDDMFEKQSALFALTVSNVVILNMFQHSIMLNHGGDTFLLKTVFQERIKLPRGETTVVVVIRDCNYETPVDILNRTLQNKMEEIWKSVHPKTPLGDYIKVQVEVLPYKQHAAFEKEVKRLKRLYVEGGFSGNRQDVVPILGFPFSAKKLWETIRANEQVDLISHWEMVSSYQCDKIVKRLIGSLHSDQGYISLKEAVPYGPKCFMSGLGCLLQDMLTRYDTEASLYAKRMRVQKRQNLLSEILNIVQPIYEDMLDREVKKNVDWSSNHIDGALEKEKCPKDAIKPLVDSCMNQFDKSCEALSASDYYSKLFAKACDTFYDKIRSYAEAEAQKVEAKREAKKERDIAVAVAAGSAAVHLLAAFARFAAGDPSGLTDFCTRFLTQ